MLFQPRFLRRAPLALALCSAFGLPAIAQTLPEVTVNAAQDEGYAPAGSRSATKTRTPLRDIPQSVQVVPAELMRDQGARSLEDALRNVPGVAMSTGDGQRDQVVIRGFSALYDQFSDGVRDDAMYFRDLADIERVEVIKGPAAVLYGRGSSGGLINRVTKKPQFGVTRGEVGLGLGSYHYQRATADLNLGLNEAAAFRLNLAKEDSDSYREQQFLKRYNVAPSLALKLGRDTDWLLQYTEADDHRLTDFGIPSLNGRPVNVDAGTYFGSSEGARDDNTQSHVRTFTSTLQQRFSDALSLRNVTRIQGYDLHRYNTVPGGPTDPVALTVGRSRSFVFRDESSLFNQTELNWRNQLGGWQQDWLIGLELGSQKKSAWKVSGGTVDHVDIFHPGRVPPPPIPDSAYQANGAIPSHTSLNTSALYAQDQITLAPRWKALLGLRYDVFSQDTGFERKFAPLARTDKKFSPRAGLVWQPSDQASYYASYSRSFQPSGEAQALSASNASNAPEITENREIGAKLDLLDGQLSLTGALFRLERSDMKNTDPSNPTVTLNVGKQRTDGLELTAAGRLPGRWDLSAGYAWLDGRMIDSLASISTGQLPVEKIPVQGQVPALTPRNSGFLWAMKDLGQGLRLGGGFNAVGARFASLTNQVTLPGYTTLDAAAQYRQGDWELDVNVKNLANRKYYVSGHGSNDNLILPGSPRALQLTLRARF